MVKRIWYLVGINFHLSGTLKKDKIEVFEMVIWEMPIFGSKMGTHVLDWDIDLNKKATEMIGLEHWEVDLVKIFAGKMEIYRASLQIYRTSLCPYFTAMSTA